MFTRSCNAKEVLNRNYQSLSVYVMLGLVFPLCITWHFYFITFLLHPVRSFCSSSQPIHIFPSSKNVISFVSFLTSYILLFQFVYEYYNTHDSTELMQDSTGDVIYWYGWPFVVISDFSSYCYEEIPDHRSYSQQILNPTLISDPEVVWSELLNLSLKSKQIQVVYKWNIWKVQWQELSELL